MTISSIGVPQPETHVDNDIVPEQPDLKDGESGQDEVNSPETVTPEPAPAPEPEKPKDEVLEALLNAIVPVQETRPNLKILIYSDPGIGKSTLLGQAPNNLIVDAEDGLASLNNHPELLGENVRVIKYKSFYGFEALIERIAAGTPELSWIETLSIDTMSELHKKGLAEVTERDWQKAPSLSNRYVAETEQHTENNEHIRRIVSLLRDLPTNIIMTSHSRTIEPKNRPSKTYPDFSEKLANTLAGMMDIVGYMEIREIDGEPKRVLRLHSDGSVTAKTRIGGYPELMVDPTWDKLWDVHQQALLANKKK